VARKVKVRCSLCKKHECKHDQKDCFDSAETHIAMYDERLQHLHRAATAIEGRHYCQAPRLQEIMLFAKEAGFKKLGMAFCIGLAEEARVIDGILAKEFEITSVCCKLSAIDKRTFGLEQINPDSEEVMCNPAGQADILNRAGTELNIICGLCVGHDAIFSLKSEAPVTTFIAKDRVLAHNPVGAVYNQYVKKRFFGE
jgi:uncharacterized metal-binding protein